MFFVWFDDFLVLAVYVGVVMVWVFAFVFWVCMIWCGLFGFGCSGGVGWWWFGN